MRSDMKALFTVFARSAVITVLAMGVLAAAALNAIPKEVAIGLALVIFIGGVAVVSRGFASALAAGRGLPRPGGDEADDGRV